MRADVVLSSLIDRWTAYTLKRAIADVAAINDQTYRDFGLDRGEVLRALGWLRSDIEARSGAAPRARRPLTIAVRTRTPQRAEAAAYGAG